MKLSSCDTDKFDTTNLLEAVRVDVNASSTLVRCLCLDEPSRALY